MSEKLSSSVNKKKKKKKRKGRCGSWPFVGTINLTVASHWNLEERREVPRGVSSVPDWAAAERECDLSREMPRPKSGSACLLSLVTAIRRVWAVCTIRVLLRNPPFLVPLEPAIPRRGEFLPSGVYVCEYGDRVCVRMRARGPHRFERSRRSRRWRRRVQLAFGRGVSTILRIVFGRDTGIVNSGTRGTGVYHLEPTVRRQTQREGEREREREREGRDRGQRHCGHADVRAKEKGYRARDGSTQRVLREPPPGRDARSARGRLSLAPCTRFTVPAGLRRAGWNGDSFPPPYLYRRHMQPVVFAASSCRRWDRQPDIHSVNRVRTRERGSSLNLTSAPGRERERERTVNVAIYHQDERVSLCTWELSTSQYAAVCVHSSTALPR